MTFHPRMRSRIEGISVVGELSWRAWDGIIADVWSVKCLKGASGEYVSHAPRLVIILDQVGEGGIDVLTRPREARRHADDIRNPISYVPAGMTVWSRVENISALRHLDIHFDVDTLAERFGGRLDHGRVETPRLMFQDERIMALARLVAAECTDPSGLGDIYGESLTTAMLTALFGIGERPARKFGRLPARQLRKVLDYIEDNCARTIRLDTLAAMAELSPSYFCEAFKASTGIPPHKWQTKVRIAHVKELLKQPGTTLTSAAAATGFADQAHLTRVFRKSVGTTPAAWRREQML